MQVICPSCQLSKRFQPREGADRQLTISCPRCAVRFSIHSTSGIRARVECPKCHKIQPDGEACAFCGLIYQKYWNNLQVVQQVEEGASLKSHADEPSSLPETISVSGGRHGIGFWLAASVGLVLLTFGLWQLHLWVGNQRTVLAKTPKAVPEIIVSVAAGAEHTAICRADGTVWTWGHNDFGQLGVESSEGVLREPHPVIGLDQVISVAAGRDFTLALKADGSVWSWGNNVYGRLGIGSNVESRNRPTQVNGLEGIVAIAAGSCHALALDTDGRVWVWGDNNLGQLADYGFTQSSNHPLLIKSLENIVAIDAGQNHSLALDSSGAVYAWGGNYYGEIGDGGYENHLSPFNVEDLPPIKAIAAGDGMTLVLDNEGTLWQWGMVHAPLNVETRSPGKLGWRKSSCEPLPTRVPELQGVKAISAGRGMMLALTADGYLWGWKTSKEWDDPNPKPFRPKLVDAILTGKTYEAFGPIVHFDAGNRYNLAVHADGTLWAWGWNYFGQLGIGDSKRGYTPTPVSDATGLLTLGNVPKQKSQKPLVAVNTDPIVVVCGDGYVLFLDADNRLWSWGRNVNGQLGRSVKEDSDHSPEPGEVMTGATAPLKSVVAGPRQGFALTTEGTVISWGERIDAPPSQANTNRFGKGPYGVRPEPFVNLNHIRSLDAGNEHYLALRNDGRVFTLGHNRYGELGTGALRNGYSPPNLVSGLPPIQAVAAGGSHSLALDEKGQVWAWGQNSNGQLGDGSTENRQTPVLIPRLNDIVAIAASDKFSLALKRDGTVWTWGAEISGSFNDVMLLNSNLPVVVGGLDDITAISCGGKMTYPGFALALKRDGTVWTWGDNRYGQLGNGSTGGKNFKPTQVPNLDRIKKISAGDAFTLVLREDGSLWGWGENAKGALGELIATATPVPVWRVKEEP